MPMDQGIGIHRIGKKHGHRLARRGVGRLEGHDEDHEHGGIRRLGIRQPVYRHLDRDEREGVGSAAVDEREAGARVDRDREVRDRVEDEGLILIGVLPHQDRFGVIHPREVHQHRRGRHLVLDQLVQEVDTGIHRPVHGRTVVADHLSPGTGVREIGQGEVSGRIRHGREAIAVGLSAPVLVALSVAPQERDRDPGERRLARIIDHRTAHEGGGDGIDGQGRVAGIGHLEAFDLGAGSDGEIGGGQRLIGRHADRQNRGSTSRQPLRLEGRGGACREPGDRQVRKLREPVRALEPHGVAHRLPSYHLGRGRLDLPEKPEDGTTVMGSSEVADWPPTVSPIGPVVAAAGMVNRSVERLKLASGAPMGPPPRLLSRIAGPPPGGAKFFPVTVTSVPIGARLGEKSSISGGEGPAMSCTSIVTVSGSLVSAPARTRSCAT